MDNRRNRALDINGDGIADLQWRNHTTGQIFIWLMNGANPPVGASPGTVSDPAWLIQK